MRSNLLHLRLVKKRVYRCVVPDLPRVLGQGQLYIRPPMSPRLPHLLPALLL